MNSQEAMTHLVQQLPREMQKEMVEKMVAAAVNNYLDYDLERQADVENMVTESVMLVRKALADVQDDAAFLEGQLAKLEQMKALRDAPKSSGIDAAFDA